MPGVGNHYIGAEILLPRGDKMARSHVVDGVMMPMRMLWAELIQIQFSIVGHINLRSLEVRSQN